ncbi:MAG: sulfatase-like hydrolase/transferase, partial [Gemmatimonadetes bacterium]|nr:sulfatase-like hydrolase/transferase [Gemmatimonadota bacterium]
MIRRAAAATALAAAGLLVAAGCGGAPQGPRDIVLLSVDTLRPDHLGCYGDPAARTPFWDALARRGVQFREALAPAPFTLPSHASLLTGEDPPAHGARANGSRALAPSGPMLAELLTDAGFRSAAFAAATVLDSTSGLTPGFEIFEWQDHPGQTERPAESVARSAREWLRELDGGRAFLFLHFYDP